MPHAKFEFISHYDFKNNVMDGIVKPYKDKESGIKIGVF
jgi:5'-nucleotidase